MVLKKIDVNPFDFNGLKITDYTAGSKEKSSFAVIEVAPGSNHGLSYSRVSDKFYYVIQGPIFFLINGTEYEFSEGDFCIIRQGEKFNYWTNEKSAVIALFHTPAFNIDNEVFPDE